MKNLQITDFSCIQNANINLSKFTVLIGEQASGKSLISKLLYFFQNIYQEQITALEDLKSLDDFKKQIKESFKDWFPPEAWGPKKFHLEFTNSEYCVRITRIEYKGNVGENIRLWLSPFIEKNYKNSLVRLNEQFKNQKTPDRTLNAIWRIQDNLELVYKKELAENFVAGQLFIPAGRSFFTSIGKFVTALEHSQMLDAVTTRFGRLFGNVKDRFNSRVARKGVRNRYLESEAAQLLFGGKVIIERNREYVETKDGRRISFSMLSSGQQELLPLMMVLDAWGGSHGFPSNIFVEEPEAHLFPSAQSLVVQFMATIVNLGSASLIVTTHSPYVLSKLNNLIKAAQVAYSSKKSAAEIAVFIPQDNWLKPNTVHAYGICNGNVIDLIDEDGLVNADYLDQVSGEISREFSRLLDAEESA